MRAALLACGLAGVGLFTVGCTPATPPTNTTPGTGRTAEQRMRDAGAAVGKAADKAGDAIGRAADATADAARENVVKPVEAMYPKVDEKLKGLSGDAATKAKEKYEAVKVLVGEFRKSSAEGMVAAKDKLLAAVEELKKMVGL